MSMLARSDSRNGTVVRVLAVNTRCYGPTGPVFGGTGVAVSARIEGW